MELVQLGQSQHLFTVAEFMTLDIASRTELLGGVIYDVSPKNEAHSGVIRRLNRELTRGLSDEYRVSVQDPIAIAGWRGPHAPEIDIAVILAKKYQQTPTQSDSRAFIEVSDTTYAHDKTTKIPLFVAARVLTWHVNLPARRVEFYRVGADPNVPEIFSGTQMITVLGVAINVEDIFEAI